jgi:WXG100 family type VII secretion target
MKVSSNEVRQAAALVKRIYGEIDRKRFELYNEVWASSAWWQGSASSSFSSEYKKINDEINVLLEILADLEGQLRKTSMAIDEMEALAAE